MEPEVLRQIVGALVKTQGVVGLGDLAVSQNGTPNMSVNVGSGVAFITGGSVATQQGTYHAYNDATVNLPIAAADPTNPRIDLVVLSIQDAFYTGSNNQALLQVVTGTPAPSPSYPAAPVSSISLAGVRVNAGATSITSGNITDVRSFSTPCSAPGGIMLNGYAQATANQTGLPTTATALSGLSVTPTIPSAHRIRVTAKAILQAGAAATQAQLNILQDGVQIDQDNAYLPAANVSQTIVATAILYPSAGPHTYSLQTAFTANTGNAMLAAATYPAYILVEDLGIF